MKRYQLSKAGVSANQGIERFNGDKGLYEEMLNNFVNDKNYFSLCEALERKDVDAAFSAAHSLKGVAGNLSMNRLFDDIFPLVEILRAGSLENIEEHMEKVNKDYQDIIAAIS